MNERANYISCELLHDTLFWLIQPASTVFDQGENISFRAEDTTCVNSTGLRKGYQVLNPRVSDPLKACNLKGK